MTPPTDPRARRLHQLARTLQAIPHIPRHSDCGCPRCRARTYSETGYPSSTLGDGIRTNGVTSSTERHALTLHPPATHLFRLDAALAAIDLATIALHNILVELGYDPANPQQTGSTTEDRVAVGRGNCLRCDTFCIGDGDNDRLRSGFCHPCYMQYRRWRKAYPEHNGSDFIRHNPYRQVSA